MSSSERVTRPTDPDGLVIEAWGQGLMVGSLVVMAAITISNMRKHIMLHKLILAELLLAIGHGTFIFLHGPAYGWYLSVTAIGLNISWSLHNVIAWLKNRPFLSRRVSIFYIATVLLVQPYWVVEIYANFTYFNNINKVFLKTRPMEPLFRDPWWIFTTCSLFYTIKREYNFSILELVRVSPRFGIMLISMCLSIAFIIVDTCTVLNAFHLPLPTGVEPFWKLSFIFKCLCDSVILDDFKTALDRMRQYWLEKRVRLDEAHHLDTYNRSSSGGGRRPVLRRDYGVEAALSQSQDDLKRDAMPRVVTTEDAGIGTGKRGLRPATSSSQSARTLRYNEYHGGNEI